MPSSFVETAVSSWWSLGVVPINFLLFVLRVKCNAKIKMQQFPYLFFLVLFSQFFLYLFFFFFLSLFSFLFINLQSVLQNCELFLSSWIFKICEHFSNPCMFSNLQWDNKKNPEMATLPWWCQENIVRELKKFRNSKNVHKYQKIAEFEKYLPLLKKIYAVWKEFTNYKNMFLNLRLPEFHNFFCWIQKKFTNYNEMLTNKKIVFDPIKVHEFRKGSWFEKSL